MPDREKVIEELQEIVDDKWMKVHADWYVSVCADAIALLKNQEAVKPIPFFTETGAESPNYVVCGHCKSIKAIMPKYTKQKYCHECGFPVLWEGR